MRTYEIDPQTGVLLADGAEVWDNTRIQAYACEMRGKLGYEEHLVPMEPAEALVFGSGFHKAVEIWTNERLKGVPDAEAVVRAHAGFVTEWEEGIPQEYREKLEIDGDRRSIKNFSRLFAGYREKFPIAGYTRILGCEVPFTFELGETPTTHVPIYWSGILDRAVEWMEGIYYRDTKTTSYQLDDDFFDAFRLSGQITGYVWAGQKQFGTKFAGAVIEGVKVEGPLKTKVREPRELVQAEVVPISQDAVEEWRVDTLRKIERIHAVRESGHYTMNRGDLCKQFRGGCSFVRICKAEPSARIAIKQQFYKERVWNPLER